jgi:hypothetical protein
MDYEPVSSHDNILAPITMMCEKVRNHGKSYTPNGSKIENSHTPFYFPYISCCTDYSHFYLNFRILIILFLNLFV